MVELRGSAFVRSALDSPSLHMEGVRAMDLFTPENAASLLVLIFLQAVLGFDNPLYISIERAARAGGLEGAAP